MRRTIGIHNFQQPLDRISYLILHGNLEFRHSVLNRLPGGSATGFSSLEGFERALENGIVSMQLVGEVLLSPRLPRLDSSPRGEITLPESVRVIRSAKPNVRIVGYVENESEIVLCGMNNVDFTNRVSLPRYLASLSS